MPEPNGISADVNDNELLLKASIENTSEDKNDEEEPTGISEVDNDIDTELQASPTARPQSRGSISTTKKVSQTICFM